MTDIIVKHFDCIYLYINNVQSFCKCKRVKLILAGHIIGLDCQKQNITSKPEGTSVAVNTVEKFSIPLLKTVRSMRMVRVLVGKVAYMKAYTNSYYL